MAVVSPAMRALAWLVVAVGVVAWCPLESHALSPTISDVSQRSAADVVAYVRGTLPGYVGGDVRLFGFSPSDILETMDTARHVEGGRLCAGCGSHARVREGRVSRHRWR